jgi:hypothetical protein
LSSRQGQSDASQARSPSTEQRRLALGSFVFESDGRTGICSTNHAAGLIALFQLASGHPGGLVGTMGHNNRTGWFQDNINAIFQADGPLGMFRQVSANVLMRNVSVATAQARAMYDCLHSNDQTGTEHEDIPAWAQTIFVCLKPSKTCKSYVRLLAFQRPNRHQTRRYTSMGTKDFSFV